MDLIHMHIRFIIANLILYKYQIKFKFDFINLLIQS